MPKVSLGIVGLPNVGKSTLFKILTRQEVNIANYPFATIDPNVGIVPVPDERLTKLAGISHSKKIVPAVVEFYDIAGLVRGASRGEGLGNQFLAHIRETQAIVIVLRTFEDPEIIHVENSVDPLRDLETINAELILKDLETVEKRLIKLEAEARSGKKEAIEDKETLSKIKSWLEGEKLPVSSENIMSLIRANKKIEELNLLTAKRQIYLLNGSKEYATSELLEKIKSFGADYLVADLAESRQIPELITTAYSTLDLISFLTTGEDETRAWTIKKGTSAPQAAGVIHSDFEKKFIRAEVINWQKLFGVAASTDSGQAAWTLAKQKGLVRLEGKEYIVQDGDVLAIRHG